jgi:hypothetical protein
LPRQPPLAAPCCCFLSSTARVAASSPGVAHSPASSAAPRFPFSPPLQLFRAPLDRRAYIQYPIPSLISTPSDGRVELRVCCWIPPPGPSLRAASCSQWPTARTTPHQTCPVVNIGLALRRAPSPSPSSSPRCPSPQPRRVSRCRARPRAQPLATLQSRPV